MKTGDICLYRPQRKYNSQFNHILFVIDDTNSYKDHHFWCGWFDYNNTWHEGLIPENYLEIIND